MIHLSINKIPIEVIYTDGYEIWRNLVIEKAHRDNEGTWVGIRKSLILTAIDRNVKLLNITVLDCDLDFSISPEEFKSKSKKLDMPSKYAGSFQLYLYPISNLVMEKNKEKMEE